jgi:hypothetical protein
MNEAVLWLVILTTGAAAAALVCVVYALTSTSA